MAPASLSTWLNGFMCFIPMVVIGFSIYWITLASDSTILKACGAGRVVLGVLLVMVGISCSVFSLLVYRNMQGMISKIAEIAQLGSTITGIVLCVIAMAASSHAEQAIFTQQMNYYCSTQSSEAFSGRCADTQYSQMKFQFALGQSAYEAYFIMGLIWSVSSVAFFASKEFGR